MVERVYENKFTLDGRLTPYAGISKAKVLAAKGLMEKAMSGDRVSDAIFRETVTSSDAMFNTAYLTSLNFIPQFDKAERAWSPVASVRTVPDFRPVVLQGLFGDLKGNGIGANGAAAKVPENTPYPHVTVKGQESAYASMAKHGFRFAYTWEAQVNDTIGFFDSLPSEMLAVSLDTEVAEVYDALIDGTGAERILQGGILPDDTVIPVNAAVSPTAIHQAIREESTRTVNDRMIGRASGYNVIVAVGMKDFIDYKINRPVISVVDGVTTYAPYDQGAIAGVTTIESDRLSGTEWYLIPKPGTTRRPVLELLRLRGHEAPELRVDGAQGSYVGGAAVSPFEGSFDADSIDFRFRYPVGAALWDSIYVVKSDGTGA
jgi:hypothetical protein